MSPAASIRFQYPWRAYQQRILDELTEHLADDQLHVVAPPGSGKTVLGLEVMRRLGKPALVLAPTLAIRNQWVERFCRLFLGTDDCPSWVSVDLRQPAWLTVSTYQALHAACTPADAAPDDTSAETPSGATALVHALQAVGLGTLVLDEAHHLQNAWWKSLMHVKQALAPTVVSLTATPPYDIGPAEWQRYCEVSGPVDAEILVPELVAAGDLCPHQDYVWFSEPTGTEGQRLAELHTRLQTEYAALCHDATVVAALEQHPALLDPESQLDWIYTNLPCYVASLIFLHANGRPLQAAHVAVLGDGDAAVPALTPAWLEVVLGFYLFAPEGFAQYGAPRRALEKHLRQQGLLEGRRVLLRHHPQLHGTLGSSLSKLHSVGRIVEFEHQHLGNRLRLVVLTDYIRKEFLPRTPENTLPLERLGALPIFELLRRNNARGIRLGVLTGSVVVVPAAALPALQAAARPLAVAAEPLPYDATYVLLQPTAAVQPAVVRLVTQLFEQGKVEVLIGTKSLLGEGWDAPCLNALVLASFVGSFVLSNQMRGRAIRTQAGNAAKTSHIWHLACLDPYDPAGGADVELLRRRFRTFVGVALPPQASGLESGLARLGVPAQLPPTGAAETLNAVTFARAADRPALAARCQQALAQGHALTEQLLLPPAQPLPKPLPRLRQLYFTRTLAYLAAELGTALLLYGAEVGQTLLRQLARGQSIRNVLWIAKLLLVAALVVFGRRLWRVLRLYLTYRDIGRDVQRIGESLLAALTQAGVVQPGRQRVVATTAPDGSVACHLADGSTFESSAFLRALQEILAPLDNPRYVVVRRSRLLGLLEQRDYHAVPEVLGRTKSLAETFAAQWQQHVGSCHLVYTRTINGRRLLLRARARSLAAALAPTPEPVSRWL